MKHYTNMGIILILVLLSLSGCIHNDPKPEKQNPPLSSQIKKESAALHEDQEARFQTLEKRMEKKQAPQPVLPKYDPLEDQKISFSMVEDKLETVLYLLADAVGMNLILDPKLKGQQNLVTLNFQNTSAKTVLKELSEQFDLDYKVEGNIIRINTFAEQFFPLNFLDTNVEIGFDVGGDVLGGGSENSTALAGAVVLKGKGPEKSNPYVVLEELVARVKSESGLLAINKLSGSLYIKDKPSVVKTVAKLLSHFREMLSRQILIEARIIEVSLSKGFEYGIDWSLVRPGVTGSNRKLEGIAWNLSNGLVFSGFDDSFTLSTVITALEAFGQIKIVSNPTIRAKHGAPAIISVGDSITYKRSVERSIETTTTGRTERTIVTAASVFDGLILGVVPFIEPNERINLLINPVKSDVDKASIEKPEKVGSDITISLPKVGIKEISTAITINSGDIIVLGGLISSEAVKQDKGVPFLSKIPLLGNVFSNDFVSEERKELVIILNVRTI